MPRDAHPRNSQVRSLHESCLAQYDSTMPKALACQVLDDKSLQKGRLGREVWYHVILEGRCLLIPGTDVNAWWNPLNIALELPLRLFVA